MTGPAVSSMGLGAGESSIFAMDASGRVVAWNDASARLFGVSPEQALGRPCWELIGGRDAFGNRFCHERCAVRCMLGRGEAVSTFEIISEGAGLQAQELSVAVFRLSPGRPGSQSLVHVVQPLDGAHARIRPGGLPVAGVVALTRRERQILGWIAAGLQNKEIAQEASISLATVRNHVHNLLEKLGLHSKLEAISLAFRNGWVGQAPRGASPQPAPQGVSGRKAACSARIA
ncbi:MAG TPA: PAS and helix-turn-helix domain-containing protein [Vicinamibacteria bacterium]|nr:PAS and helix-turn-helix domain-containing protein [Vicinamibacteria bacterium]